MRSRNLFVVLLVIALVALVCMGAKVWRFDGIQITSGTTSANAINFGSDVAVYRDSAARLANANKTYLMDDVIIGSAYTKRCTFGALPVMPPLPSDPLDATPGNRPAGAVGGYGHYNGAMYFCTNATTPTWVKVGPAS